MRLLHERPTISLLQPVVRAIQYLVQTWCCHFEFRSPFVALDNPGRFRQRTLQHCDCSTSCSAGCQSHLSVMRQNADCHHFRGWTLHRLLRLHRGCPLHFECQIQGFYQYGCHYYYKAPSYLDLGHSAHLTIQAGSSQILWILTRPSSLFGSALLRSTRAGLLTTSDEVVCLRRKRLFFNAQLKQRGDLPEHRYQLDSFHRS